MGGGFEIVFPVIENVVGDLFSERDASRVKQDREGRNPKVSPSKCHV